MFGRRKKAVCILIFALICSFISCKQNNILQNTQQGSFNVLGKEDESKPNEMFHYQKYEYQIDYEFLLIKNNSVGNQWIKKVYINGEEVQNGHRISASCKENIEIKAEITESDKMPDKSSCVVNLCFEDRAKICKQIIVRENRGQYSGNVAIWEFSCEISLVKVEQ